MRAVWMRARSDLRARWRSWLGLALVIGLASGAVLASVAAARRTETAYARFARAEHAADERIYTTPNPDTGQIDFARVIRLPQVAESGRMRYFATAFPNTNVVASPDQSLHVEHQGLDRVKVTSGRAARPDRVDEAMVDFALAQRDHLHPGSVLPITFLGQDQQSVVAQLRTRVVGVVAVPSQFPPTSTRGYLADPWVYLTPAFYRTYGDRLVAFDLVAVRVKPGQGRAFEDALPSDSLGKAVPGEVAAEQAKAVEHGFGLQGTALWLLAGLAGLTAVLVVGQLVARQVFLESADDPVLSALGLTRWQRFSVAMVRAVFAGLVGAAIAFVTAWLLSPLAPLGTARLAEPHPGLAFDGVALPLGAIAVLVLVPIMAAWPAWRASRTLAPHWAPGVAEDIRVRPSVAADAAGRAGLPPTVTSGLRMALEPGRGRSAIPVRSSVVGAAVGLSALAAAITFGGSLQHLVHSPPLYGVNWDADVLNNSGPPAVPAGVPIAKADPDVVAVAMEDGAPLEIDGRSVGAVVFDAQSGSLDPVLLSGRLPRGPAEIALGARTMADLHAKVGAIVPVQAWSRDGPRRPLRVVGKAVLPPGIKSYGHNPELGQGAILEEASLGALIPPGFSRPGPYTFAVRFADGVDRPRALARLFRDLRAKDENFVAVAPDTPATVVDFGHVTNLPLVLAGLLAAVAAATIAHLLITSVRRRRRDLAVLKTLGFVPGQVRATVAWQATSLVAIAIAIGLPVGVALGRAVWGRFAANAGFVSEPVVPSLATLLVIPAALLLANLVAAIPAWLAGRVPAAGVLRTE